jgi:hypothetical protein
MKNKIMQVAAFAAPVASFFAVLAAHAQVAMPTSTWSTLTANAGTQISDPGLLLVLGGVAGVYLATYFIHFLIGLIPKGKSGSKK